MEEMKSKSYMILKRQLAIEHFESQKKLSQEEGNLIHDTYDMLNNYRENRKNASKEKLDVLETETLDTINKTIDALGKQHFIFYDDGSIEYGWEEF
ncbi:MAG: hypothetical protein PHT75_02905 [Bacilli bacterium]|nr:hypothetical protein [Bacilli bacterium]MDD3305056.1 hypothetical protein [Bacilli bacterium]MDD4053481.1 hypothetical protein [Bacilli bacterium]MDD4411516.1 hypothetical protein [Bacilli bacterium]